MKEPMSRRMSFGKKAVYGSGNFAANLMNCTVGTYISFYYTEIAGLPIAAVGVILLLCRLLDGVTDLCMGVIVENTKSRAGKARPWILRMAVPYGISVFLMFFSPGWGTTGKIIYAAATYMAGIAIVYTAISVPYNTLSALITTNPDDRTSLATMRQFFGFMGPLIITAISLPVVNALGADQRAWSILTAAYGVIGTVIYLVVYFSTKELEAQEPKTEKEKSAEGNTAKGNTAKGNTAKGNTVKAVKALFKNQYWMMVLGLTLLIFISYGVKGGVQVYYCKYVLGNDNLYSLMSVASQIPNILLCFVIPSVAKKYGKRNVSLAGCIAAVAGAAVMLINPESLTVLLVSTVLNTIGMAPISICVFAMLGDTAAYGEWKTNVRNEGMVFSATTFAEKVGNAFGSAMTAFVLALGGFVGNAAAQSASAVLSMKVCMIGFPILIAVIAAVILKFYKLDEEYPRISRELEARKQS